MSTSSSWTGQRALLPLPSVSSNPERTLSTFNLPSSLIYRTNHGNPSSVKHSTPKGNNSSSQQEDCGLPVLKVSKTGKLQTRRIGISPDRRYIFVTTHRPKRHPARLIKGLMSSLKLSNKKANNNKNLNNSRKDESSVLDDSFTSTVDGSVQDDPNVDIKWIPLAAVDRIQRGSTSHRFVLARQQALLERDGQTVVKLLDRGEAKVGTASCLSIVYRVPAAAPSTSGKTNSNLSMMSNPSAALSSSTETSFSRHQGGRAVFETLDIAVPHAADYDALVMVLDGLHELCQQELQRDSCNIRLLNSMWVDFGKPWQSDIACSEFLSLCQALHVPTQRPALQALFQEECVKCDRHDDLRLSFAAISKLMEHIRGTSMSLEKNPFERLWAELMASDPVPSVGWHGGGDQSTVELSIQDKEDSISAVAFLSFLRSQQKEYSTSLEETVDLMHKLNELATSDDLTKSARRSTMGSDRLSKQQVFAFLMSDANDLFHPVRGMVGADDMNRPLSHYWINTSHDTYLAPIAPSLHGDNAYLRQGKSGHVATDEQAYMASLLRGVRCLDIDVWDSWNGKEPVVARMAPKQGHDHEAISFEVVIRSIRAFLDQQPQSYPIILKMENHCSYGVQDRLAKLLQDLLGSADLIVRPELLLDAKNFTLPSPESIRGKVLIIGKRPKGFAKGELVQVDDFDTESQLSADVDTTLEDNHDGSYAIVGFGEHGPVRSHSVDAAKSPSELLAIADRGAEAAAKEARDADIRARSLLKEAELQEQRSDSLAQAAGLSLSDVKRLASLASDDGSAATVKELANEEKSNKEEGMEVHDMLPEYVNASRSNYEAAADLAMTAAGYEAQCHVQWRDMEEAFIRTKANLDMSQAQEKLMLDKARKAAAEARAHQGHAESAIARVERVRELLGTSMDQSSSAGNVVQTALTEAKISEKRAAEAESRAQRAAAAAENDRIRADAESKKEEMLEQEVNALHYECMKATSVAKTCRDRVDKATSMLERVHEQIRLIERSSQYRREMESQASPKGDSFTVKHSAKQEERRKCEELISEASLENSVAENERDRLQHAFEAKSYLWKMQADAAAKARKTADRSLHVSEELAEDAVEEREAANLRHIARQRAEATVANKGSHMSSFEEQLAEAERAADEACDMATSTKKKADHLEREAEKVGDHSRFKHALEEADLARKNAQLEYELAKTEREAKDVAMMEEKRRLESSSEVYQTAQRTLASEVDRKQAEAIYQQEAVAEYKKAVAARQEALMAAQVFEACSNKVVSLRCAAKHARNYKARMDKMMVISTDLAKMTLLTSNKFTTWEKSLSFSNAYMHSLTQSCLLLKVDQKPKEEVDSLLGFTRTHLLRVIPSWPEIHRKASCSNYDPVFAWALGCQLVATNFHSVDENLFISEGRFRQNGSCGFALKPAHLIDEISKADTAQKWTFTVLGGFNLPGTEKKTHSFNPIVKVSMYSGSAKEMRISYRTKPAMQNGLNPAWTAHNKFSFTIPTPSVSMLAFSVWHVSDAGDEHFCAAAALPAGDIRQGYRSVALFDRDQTRSGAMLSAGLLVKATRR